MTESVPVDSLRIETLLAWMRGFGADVHEQAAWLTELDSAIGDADHGTNMERGTTALLAALDQKPPADTAALFKTIGMAVVSKVGGASGSLYGTFFLEMAKNAPTATELSAAELETSLRAGVSGIIARGRAAIGDKTMIDALAPAIDTLAASMASGAALDEALKDAADAAEQGRDATKPLVARKGRASYLGERSADHLDPGAASAALLIRSLAVAVGAAG